MPPPTGALKLLPRRETATDNRIQIKHPITGLWMLLDTRTGRTVAKRNMQFGGVPVKERP